MAQPIHPSAGIINLNEESGAGLLFCNECLQAVATLLPDETYEQVRDRFDAHIKHCTIKIQTLVNGVVRVEIEQENAVSSEPAHVRVHVGDTLVADITGNVVKKPGADGGLYSCVHLKNNPPQP